jgi:hypothetical protein
MSGGNQNFLAIIVLATFGLLSIKFIDKILLEKMSDRVVEKLIQEYSPSPYGPSVDPDKIDVDKLSSSEGAIRAIQIYDPF